MTNIPLWREILCPDSGDRYFHTSTLYKDYIITHAGRSQKSDKNLKDFQILNIKTGQYEPFKLEGDQPIQRYRHSACLFDSNKILIFGGYHDGILNDTAIVTIEETTPLTLRYEKITTTGGEDLKRCSHSANVHKNKMYIFGGRHHNNPLRSNNELWSLDLETFVWEKCETDGGPCPRTTHCSAVYKDGLYIFGGYSDSEEKLLADCYFLSFEDMSWGSFEPDGEQFLARFGASSAVLGDTLYLIGGSYGSEDKKNEVMSYNLKENYLDYAESAGDYVSVRFGTTIAYKNSLITWGGLKRNKDSTSQITCLKLGRALQNNGYEGGNDSFSTFMGHLFNSEQYSDIHFAIEGEKIPAHKVVLSARSKHFHNLFAQDPQLPVLEISDVKLETFKALLGFMYQNQVELNEPLALDLYVVAEKYGQKELVSICDEFLTENLKLDNLQTMIDFIEKVGAESFKEKVLEFMTIKIQEIKEKREEYKIPQSYLWEIASRSVKSSK